MWNINLSNTLCVESRSTSYPSRSQLLRKNTRWDFLLLWVCSWTWVTLYSPLKIPFPLQTYVPGIDPGLGRLKLIQFRQHNFKLVDGIMNHIFKFVDFHKLGSWLVNIHLLPLGPWVSSSTLPQIYTGSCGCLDTWILGFGHYKALMPSYCLLSMLFHGDQACQPPPLMERTWAQPVSLAEPSPTVGHAFLTCLRTMMFVIYLLIFLDSSMKIPLSLPYRLYFTASSFPGGCHPKNYTAHWSQ